MSELNSGDVESITIFYILPIFKRFKHLKMLKVQKCTYIVGWADFLLFYILIKRQRFAVPPCKSVENSNLTKYR
jgi:hypothetical protein